MVAVIMTAGLSVDFTVHIILHYLVNGERYDNKAERMDATLRTCGLSLLQVYFCTCWIIKDYKGSMQFSICTNVYEIFVTYVKAVVSNSLEQCS